MMEIGAHQLDDRDRESHDPCVYLCGNSLGLQPRRVATRLNQYLTTWATQGVFGHFKPLSDSPLPTWLDADEKASKAMAPIVGADPSEIAIMATLTANLHFLMSSFYRPDPNGRHKIILESKAFPSDHVSLRRSLSRPLFSHQKLVCRGVSNSSSQPRSVQVNGHD